MKEQAISQRTAGTDMPTGYDPQVTEKRWYAERRGYFGAKAGSGREPFCIMLPPPNVTGALYIGHDFASLWHDAGASLKGLWVAMGHSDIRTTLNLYAHL